MWCSLSHPYVSPCLSPRLVKVPDIYFNYRRRQRWFNRHIEQLWPRRRFRSGLHVGPRTRGSSVMYLPAGKNRCSFLCFSFYNILITKRAKLCKVVQRKHGHVIWSFWLDNSLLGSPVHSGCKQTFPFCLVMLHQFEIYRYLSAAMHSSILWKRRL